MRTTVMTGMIVMTGMAAMNGMRVVTGGELSMETGSMNAMMATVTGIVAVPDTVPASDILGTCKPGLPLAATTAVRAETGRAATAGTARPKGHVLGTDRRDNQALNAFFAEHEDKAFYVAYAALWDRENALDAVQESMLKMVEYYSNKPPDDWPALFRTVLNSKINDLRRKRLLEQGKHKLVSLTGLFRRRGDDGEDTEFELPAPERSDGITGPEESCAASELRQRIDHALLTLSERQRQVFILREWRGMTIREAADTLGCSENSIKQHHFRALRELRRQLAEVWEYAQASTS